MHAALALGGCGHAAPHTPQWSVLTARFVSQPLEGSRSHSPYPAPQTNEHAPPEQLPRAFAAIGQTRPHAPQLDASVLRLKHPLPQAVVPEAQVLPQVAIEHTSPRPHTVPQRPQFVLVVVAVSHPLTTSPSQSPNPGTQLPIPHRPIAHEGSALGAVHTVVHALHAVGVEFRSVSQPLVGSPSQSPEPGSQRSPHAPRVHTAVALGPPGHIRPHAPQWFRLLSSETSQPLDAL